MFKVARRTVGQHLGQLFRRIGGSVPGRRVSKLHRLVPEHVGKILVAVADVDAPHPRRAIDQVTPQRVFHIDAITGQDRAEHGRADVSRDRPGLHQRRAPVVACALVIRRAGSLGRHYRLRSWMVAVKVRIGPGQQPSH